MIKIGRNKILVLLIAVFFMLGSSSVYAQYVNIDGPFNIPASGVVPSSEVITGLPIIDDFEDNGVLNNLGGNTGSFDGGGGSATNGNVDQGFSIEQEIIYNVSPSGSFSGYFTQLLNSDFTPYGYLSFDVRGASGGEYFKIQLKSNTGQYLSANVMVTDFLPSGVTTSKQTVQIPLINFTNLVDISDMDELVFVFENSASSANGSPTSGTIYLDNIMVVSGSPSTFQVDNFQDLLEVDSTGGNVLDVSPNGAGISHTMTGADMESSYNLDPITAPWAGHTFILGGGNDGSTTVPRSELLSFDGITLDANLQSGGSPKVKVELRVTIDGPLGVETTSAFAYINNFGSGIYLDFDSFSAFYFGVLTTNFWNDVTWIDGKVSIIYEYDANSSNGGVVAFDNITWS